MTRAAKQKAVRQSTAAYAASQPLFDALRIGFNRVGEQKAQLSIARDIVQHLHVKVVDQDSYTERSKHERYIDCAVKAWRSATDIYADIFQSLAKVTAAEAAEGREERTGHAEFAEMARTAAEAKSAAGAFVLYEDISKAGAEQAADSEEDSEDESEDDSADQSEDEEEAADEKPMKSDPVNIEPTNPVLLHLLGKRQLPPPKEEEESPHKAPRLSDNIKYDSQGRKILWEKGAEKPNVPYGTLGGREKKAWKAEKRRQKREKKQVKRAAKMMDQAAAKQIATGANGVDVEAKHVEDTSRPVHDRDFISLDAAAPRVVPDVQYLDVSAEVEARLKAKERVREGKKKEKKRKRESGESVEGVGEEDGVEIKVEKPKKKRAKSEVTSGETEATVKSEKTEKKEKRRKSEADGDEGDESEGRKKRKKVKQ